MRIGRFLQKIYRFLESLPAVPSRACVCCGKTASGHTESGALCETCSSQIPWIRAVSCPVCGRAEECPDCVRREQSHLVLHRSAVRYNAAMKGWLARYKYRGDERLAPLFAEMAAHAFRMLLQEAGEHELRSACFTFIPLSRERFEERGFNQSEQLARRLGGIFGLPVVPMLERGRHTQKQSFKTRRERLLDLKGAFNFNLPESFERKHFPNGPIILVDDVYTTGSTLNECAAVIRSQLDVEVYGLTWARA
ncbi:ComF family protein [Ferviditalea candida]|uniref:ComF family protein n=1 Tax=Ferviditalea candida TaxID=3108399 RepID=A0ABU5ZJE8_9BACL|nr:ComF family protein [Paenibacillaceae bacterium T2]